MEYGHILPIARKQENILPSLRDHFWNSFPKLAVKLHNDFHHLNSSQALCFNLFYALLLNGTESFSPLLRALHIEDDAVLGALFEFVPDAAEGTNIDFMLPLASGARVLFEVKYTEADFGAAKDDVRHRAKFADVYAPRLDSRFTDAARNRSHFFRHYQIMRTFCTCVWIVATTLSFWFHARTNPCDVRCQR